MTVFRLTDEPQKETGTNKEQQETVENLTTQTASQTETDTGQGDPKHITIALKGPLGHTYTDILNLLLDKRKNSTGDIRQESVQQALHANFLYDEEMEEQGDHKAPAGYIYVYDGKKMNLGDLSSILEQAGGKAEAMDEKGYVAAVIENPEPLIENPKLAPSLDTVTLALESINVPLFFTREAAVNGILNFIRR